ncbi:MAG: hypothetical protein ACRDYD_12555, partial [Acidimicrobiales bacterium]
MSATDPPGPAGAGGADPAGAEAPALAVGVLGASGRMGSTVCEAVASDPALELVAAVDRAGAGRLCAGGGAVIS